MTIQDIERSGLLGQGKIRGVEAVQIDGERFDLPGGADITIWDGPGTVDYTFTDPASARINCISSSSDLDTGFSVPLEGLDENWSRSFQSPVLNGRNKVYLSPELIRLNFAYSSKDLAGDVYIYEDGPITLGIPDDLTTVKGFIRPENNKIKAFIYSVPAGYILNFKVANYGVIPSLQCCIRFRNYVRKLGEANIKIFENPVPYGGTTFIEFAPKTAFPVLEKSDLMSRVLTSNQPGSGVTVVGDWELIKV